MAWLRGDPLVGIGPMSAYGWVRRNRPFALIWAGATVSIFGDAITWVSLVWLTLERGGSAFDVGLLAVCYTAPVLVGGLAAGLLLDRFDRHRLLIADNTIRGLTMLSVPLAATFGVLGQLQLDAVAAVYGLLYMVSLAGFPSMIPDLVGPDELSAANAMESLSFAVGGVAGPAVAGVLIGAIGAANNLVIDALSYAIFVACLALAGRDRHQMSGQAVAGRATGGAPATAGLGPALSYIRHTPAILAITVMFMFFNVGEGMITVLLPVYAREVLAAGATGYGALVSAFTAGSLVGSFAVGAIRWRWPLGRSIAAAQLLAGLALVILIAQPPIAGALLTLALVGLLASPLTIWAQTIRMRLIPQDLRGRAFALLRTLMQSTPPVGGLAAGILLAGPGIGLVVALVALLIAAPGAAGLTHPSLATARTLPPPVPDPPI